MKKNFNEHAVSYDKSAIVQQKVCKTLAQIINQSNDINSVYEIGCGTGNLSVRLIKKFKNINITLNDICPNMIKKAEQKIGRFKSDDAINFIQGDIERIKIKNKYDLVCSSSVFQWIRDLSGLFLKIKKSLNQKGSLVFSMFIEGTFNELDRAFYEASGALKIKYEKKTIDFSKKEKVKDILHKNGFNLIYFKSKNYTEYYGSVFEFLKEIRNIGASGFNESRTDYKIIKKTAEIYKNKFINKEGKIKVTYKVLFCKASV